MQPVLIHLPHSSLYIPESMRREIVLSDSELREELLRITDRYTDELFVTSRSGGVGSGGSGGRGTGAVLHKNEVSRLVFDPERFRRDADEPMARFGMGAVYTHTSDHKLLRVLTEERREEILRELYDPYHASLTGKVKAALAEHGRCLIIDAHSFPSEPQPFEEDKVSKRPDICLGTSSFHTPEALASAMEHFVTGHGMSVMRNFPFAGTMVSAEHYMKDRRVASIMIEVNRRLYMDEATGRKLDHFGDVGEFVRGLVRVAVEAFEGTLRDDGGLITGS